MHKLIYFTRYQVWALKYGKLTQCDTAAIASVAADLVLLVLGSDGSERVCHQPLIFVSEEEARLYNERKLLTEEICVDSHECRGGATLPKVPPQLVCSWVAQGLGGAGE